MNIQEASTRAESFTYRGDLVWHDLGCGLDDWHNLPNVLQKKNMWKVRGAVWEYCVRTAVQ
jgi:hypothetical protein